jgi:hypothetical protein
MRINYEKQRKIKDVCKVHFDKELNLDWLINKLQDAKEQNANIVEFDNFGYYISFRKEVYETDEEQQNRIKREEKMSEDFEKLKRENRYELYKELKKEFENGQPL